MNRNQLVKTIPVALAVLLLVAWGCGSGPSPEASVEEHANGDVEVSVVDPIASMMAVENKNLGLLATVIQQKLKHAIERL